MPYEAEAEDVLHDAQAFWLRAPGRGESPPVALPEPCRGDALGDGARDLDGLVVTLHESRVEWASYERPL